MKIRMPYIEIGWSFWITGRKKPRQDPAPVDRDRGPDEDDEFSLTD